MKKVIKLLSGEIVFGEVEAAKDGEILIMNPWTADKGNLSPYMMIEMGEAVKAIQVHSMNIMWAAPLEDFVEANKVYVEKTTGIVTEQTPKIIM